MSYEVCVNSERQKGNQKIKVKRRSYKTKQGWQIAAEMHKKNASTIDKKNKTAARRAEWVKKN